MCDESQGFSHSVCLFSLKLVGIVVDGALLWYCITCYYFLKVKSLFRSIIFSSLFLGLSAQAKKICPQGYTDAYESTELRHKLYITYNGNRYDCFEDTSGAYSWGRYDCGDGRRGDNMTMYIPSKEGIRYKFFGNDAGHPGNFERIDCSFGSYCLLTTLKNNLARPEEPQIKFNVLISEYWVSRINCNKLSF